jgi:hypothetical protein
MNESAWDAVFLFGRLTNDRLRMIFPPIYDYSNGRVEKVHNNYSSPIFVECNQK